MTLRNRYYKTVDALVKVVNNEGIIKEDIQAILYDEKIKMYVLLYWG